MAGIFAIFKKKRLINISDDQIEAFATKLKHRGPIHTFKYEKFPIKIIFHQSQKLISNNKNLNFAVNKDDNMIIAIDGFIYNLDDIYHKFLNSKYFQKYSDANLEGIIAAYNKINSDIFIRANGVFSGILFDGNELIGFKDPIGTKPLYYCNANDFFALSSELKALAPLREVIKLVNPGHIISSSGNIKQFYKYPIFKTNYELSRRKIKKFALKLNGLVKIAVADNINNGENIGVLLNGGINSIILTHIAIDLIKNLHVYTVGVEGSRDLDYAQDFASLHGLDHTIIKITSDDMIQILPEVIYTLESYDAALIRSSVPMFLLYQKIKDKEDSDILLTGEGGDELFGGYEYFKNLQSSASFTKEIMHLLEIEHKRGFQKIDRISNYFSLETRVPLFDCRLVDFSFKISSELKILRKKGIGFVKKWILRKAFEKEISEKFIWRKEQKFSEGDGSRLLLLNYIDKEISDEDFKYEKKSLPFLNLQSKEELYYWKIFSSYFKLNPETLANIRVK